MLDEDNFEYDEDFITGMNPNYSSPIYGHEHFGGSVYMSEGEVNISSLSLDPDNNKDNNRDGEQVNMHLLAPRLQPTNHYICMLMQPHLNRRYSVCMHVFTCTLGLVIFFFLVKLKRRYTNVMSTFKC